MTQILTIGNIAKYKFFGNDVPRPTDTFRINDSPKAVAQRLYRNPNVRTEGEFELSLLADRLAIHKDWYGDAEGVYTESQNLINQAVNNGLHDTTNFTGSVSQTAKGIALRIIKAAKKKTILSPVFMDATRSISGIGMFDPFGNDPIIDLNIQCAALQQQLAVIGNNIIQNQGNAFAVQQLQAQFNIIQDQLSDCSNDSNIVDLYNQHLEKSGHDFVYGYFSATELLEMPFTVQLKASRHRGATERLAGFANTISTDNLKMWIENGVMRENARSQNEPFNAKESAIAVSIANYKTQNGINAVITTAVVIGLIGLAAKIIDLVRDAIKDKNSLANKFSPEKLAALALDQFATGEFDVNDTDWLGFANDVFDSAFGGTGGGTDSGTGTGTGTDNSNTQNTDNKNLFFAAGGAAILAALLLRK